MPTRNPCCVDIPCPHPTHRQMSWTFHVHTLAMWTSHVNAQPEGVDMGCPRRGVDMRCPQHYFMGWAWTWDVRAAGVWTWDFHANSGCGHCMSTAGVGMDTVDIPCPRPPWPRTSHVHAHPGRGHPMSTPLLRGHPKPTPSA